jgi:hypothetical protein
VRVGMRERSFREVGGPVHDTGPAPVALRPLG